MSDSTRTLVLCKPDAVERGLVGEIVGRLERKGLTIVALELRTIDSELAGRHYEEHRERPFFGDLVTFITRSRLGAMLVEGGPTRGRWCGISWVCPTPARPRPAPSAAISRSKR